MLSSDKAEKCELAAPKAYSNHWYKSVISMSAVCHDGILEIRKIDKKSPAIYLYDLQMVDHLYQHNKCFN